MIKIGAHVSAAGGADQAPLNAHDEQCECFQFFSRPPQGGKAPVLTPEIINNFKKLNQKFDLESYIHTPYYINLASANNRIKYGSIQVIREELERASLLGVKYVMTHLGSANGKSSERVYAFTTEVIKNLNKSLSGYQGSAMLLIENSAGSGKIIGSQFSEIKKIIQGLNKFSVGVCLDVMHAFASGYEPAAMIDLFAKEIGIKYLKLIHCNDAKTDLGSRVDRHEHIGLGKMGLLAFKNFISDKRLQKINFILETPSDNRAADLKTLKKLRKQAIIKL